MRVLIYLGEPFWRAAGRRQVELALAEGATVADALAALAHTTPALAADLASSEARPLVFVNDEAATPETALLPDAQLHLVWPVSGG